MSWAAHKGFIAPLLLVLVIFLIAGGAYFYTKTNQTSTSQTATTTPITQQADEWKTYTNTEPEDCIRIWTKEGGFVHIKNKGLFQAFSIQYPPDAEVNEEVGFDVPCAADLTKGTLERKGNLIIAYGVLTESYNGTKVEFPDQALASAKAVLATLDTQESLNLKTYRNEEYGFEIQYPPIGLMQRIVEATSTYAEKTIEFQAREPYFPGDVFETFLYITVFDNPEKTSLHDWFIKHVDPENLLLPYGTFAEEVENGISTIRWTGKGVPNSYANGQHDPIGVSDLVISSDHSKIFALEPGSAGPSIFSRGREVSFSTFYFENDLFSTFKFVPSTTIQSTDWKTYRDEKYGFEFKYPNSWTLIGQALYPPGKAPSPANEYLGDILFDVLPNPNRSNLSDFYKNADTNLFTESKSHTSMVNNGLEIEKFIGIYGMFTSNVAAINLGRIVVELTDVDQAHEDDGIFDQIISSLTPTTALQTSGWETYRNEEFKFQVQYPKDWTLDAHRVEGGGWYVGVNTPKLITTPADFRIFIFPAESLDNWYAFTFRTRQAESPELMPKKENTTVGGLPAFRIVDPVSEGGCDSVYLAVFFDDNVYRIQDPSCSSNPVVSEIASSFKFIR